jgi:hypothetical protein
LYRAETFTAGPAGRRMLAMDGCASSSSDTACCFCVVRALGGLRGVAVAMFGPTRFGHAHLPMRARYQDLAIIRRQAIFCGDREKRSWGEPMKGALYPEEWVERDNHWFIGPPRLRLDGLARLVRILVSSRSSGHLGVSKENALRRFSEAVSSRTCSSAADRVDRRGNANWIIST